MTQTDIKETPGLFERVKDYFQIGWKGEDVVAGVGIHGIDLVSSLAVEFGLTQPDSKYFGMKKGCYIGDGIRVTQHIGGFKSGDDVEDWCLRIEARTKEQATGLAKRIRNNRDKQHGNVPYAGPEQRN